MPEWKKLFGRTRVGRIIVYAHAIDSDSRSRDDESKGGELFSSIHGLAFFFNEAF